jgi:hypothetical protein
MALDSCHQQVVNALRKAGWQVNDKPVHMRADGLAVFADLQAQLNNGSVQTIIIVEVKCFADERFDQDELYRAVGQYLLYRSMLRVRGFETPLYLAIPEPVYQRLFLKNVVQDVLQESRIKLIIVDIEREEVLQWLD